MNESFESLNQGTRAMRAVAPERTEAQMMRPIHASREVGAAVLTGSDNLCASHRALLRRGEIRAAAVLIALLRLAQSTPLHAQPIGDPLSITVIDSGAACSVTAACATFPLGSSTASVTLAIAGTWTGTLTFEGTNDGQSWVSLLVTNVATGVRGTTTTANGLFSAGNGGVISVRARATGAITGAARVTAARGSGTVGGNDATGFTGVLAAINGGTGQSSYAVGDLLSANTTTSLSKVPAVATGSVFASAGTSTLPVWTASPSITGSYTQTLTALGTTSTDGVVLANSTAATAGVPVQYSPRIRLRSNVWNTTATAATNTNDWSLE